MGGGIRYKISLFLPNSTNFLCFPPDLGRQPSSRGCARSLPAAASLGGRALHRREEEVQHPALEHSHDSEAFPQSCPQSLPAELHRQSDPSRLKLPPIISWVFPNLPAF